MNVGELKNILEDMDEDKEVRIAFQPNWPLRARIQSVVDGEEFNLDRPECYQCGAPATCTVAEHDLPLCDEHGMKEERPLEHLETEESTPESAEFVWIAVDQVSSYSEHPYAPREAWQ